MLSLYPLHRVDLPDARNITLGFSRKHLPLENTSLHLQPHSYILQTHFPLTLSFFPALVTVRINNLLFVRNFLVYRNLQHLFRASYWTQIYSRKLQNVGTHTQVF